MRCVRGTNDEIEERSDKQTAQKILRYSVATVSNPIFTLARSVAQFAPIKNKEGSDSRETALRLLTNLWKKRVGGEGLENVDVLDIEGWEGNEEKVREEVKRRAGEGETVITVWEREWE